MKLNFKLCVGALSLSLGMSQAALLVASQNQSQQAEEQKEQKKKKKGGGFLKGLKSVTGQGSEQQEATATAGSKSVGEGEKIGKATPTTADRQQINALENYSVPEADMKKFQKDGHLEPKAQ